jgi:hypothetical protein
MKAKMRSRRSKERHSETRREPSTLNWWKPKPKATAKPKTKPKPKPRNTKMPEKKDTDKDLFAKEKDTEGEEKKPLDVRVVAGPEPKPLAHQRSDTEQSIIDSYGDDPSKFKEGTHERDLVESLPENIAKKREEEEKKKSDEKK